MADPREIRDRRRRSPHSIFASLLACMARVRRDVGWLDVITVGRAWFAILLLLTPFWTVD